MNQFSEFDYVEVETKLFGDHEDYGDNHPNGKTARLYLYGIDFLNGVNNDTSDKFQDARHWLQKTLITKSINSLRSHYLLLKYHQYDSANRDVRFLLEAFMLINYLNENKIETGELPLPTRRRWRLVEAGASCFRDTLFHGCSACADHPRRERSLRRRGFGVSHSYSLVTAIVAVAHLLVGVLSGGHEWCHHSSSLRLALL